MSFLVKTYKNHLSIKPFGAANTPDGWSLRDAPSTHASMINKLHALKDKAVEVEDYGKAAKMVKEIKRVLPHAIKEAADHENYELATKFQAEAHHFGIDREGFIRKVVGAQGDHPFRSTVHKHSNS